MGNNSILKNGVRMRNLYKVPRRQWVKWSDHAQQVFNMLYPNMRNNQWAFLHPGAVPMEGEHWKTVSWNAAWTAADAVDGFVTKAEKGGE